MKKKILLVDDEINIGLLLENFLSHDYDIRYARSAEDGIEWLEENLPDLIICDIEMTGSDGYSLLTQVRQRGYTSHTPIIMLSAKSESKERIKCYKLGAQDYLTKPFNPEELELVIKKNLFPINYSIVW
jgi:DNA-binding response OmpR family regulator